MSRWILALTAVSFLACHPKSKRTNVFISRIVVSEATLSDNGALAVTAVDLKRRLTEAFDSTAGYKPLVGDGDPDPKAAEAYRARIELTYTRESDEVADGGAALREAEVGVSLTLSLAHTDGEVDQLRSESTAARLFDPGAQGSAAGQAARTKAFQAALDAALRRAAADLLLQIDAAHKTDGELIADLQSHEVGVRDSAVRQLAERKNPAAVPALIQRLGDGDREVVLRAMGALEGIRDPRAVRPLIDLTERQDPSFVAQVIYVIGAIGGPDAEAFLYTLQNGSQEQQVRVAATEASEELRRRRKQPHGSKAAGPAQVR